MKIADQQIEFSEPSLTMEIPYLRTERKHLFFKKEFKEVKILEFKSSVLVTVNRILRLVTKLPTEFVGSTKHDVSNNLMIKHKDDIIEIIALSIQNNSKKVDPELLKFINENFNPRHLMEAFNYVMVCLNLESLLMGIMIFKPSIQSSFDSAKAREQEIRQITSC